jgi:hypothetical protein
VIGTRKAVALISTPKTPMFASGVITIGEAPKAVLA